MKCCKCSKFKEDSSTPCYKRGPVDLDEKAMKSMESPMMSNSACPKDGLRAIIMSDKGLELKYCTMVAISKIYAASKKISMI